MAGLGKKPGGRCGSKVSQSKDGKGKDEQERRPYGDKTRQARWRIVLDEDQLSREVNRRSQPCRPAPGRAR